MLDLAELLVGLALIGSGLYMAWPIALPYYLIGLGATFVCVTLVDIYSG